MKKYPLQWGRVVKDAEIDTVMVSNSSQQMGFNGAAS